MAVGSGPVSYYIRVFIIRRGASIVTRPNIPDSSLVKKGQMRDYLFRFSTTLDEENISLKVKLESSNGDASIYIRQCKKLGIGCEFSDDSIVSSKMLPDD